jgi:hypothetical protein
MSVIIAEYLGQRTDRSLNIQPVLVSKTDKNLKPTVPCPFKNSHCDKAKRGDKPVCSIRDVATNIIWVVCSHRLCSTSPKDKPLNQHQKDILFQVGKAVFGQATPRSDMLVDREVPIPVTESSSYSADYVMWRNNPTQISAQNTSPDRPMVLEMQGGGETTNTGVITAHVSLWEKGKAVLNESIEGAAPLVTNAWRRQQEQFLVKGNVAMYTGGRMVFCIGTMIYDYLIPRLKVSANFTNLSQSNWTLALLVFMEDKSAAAVNKALPNSIPLIIDTSRSLFTNYATFVQAITNQGQPYPPLFNRAYQSI